MDNKFYVYEWYNIDTQEVFYVGKGCGKRYLKTNRNKDFNEYYKNHNVDVRIIYQNLFEEEAFKKEKELTDFYKEKNQCQCNLAPAGQGGCHFVWTDEMKDYWSKNNPMKAEEQRQRMRENNPMHNKEIALKNGAKHKQAIIIDNIIYDGLVDAAKVYNVSSITIGNWCLAGKSPSGLICGYLDSRKTINKRGNKVIVDGILYNSGIEAALAVGLKPVTLNKALREHRKICMGHTCEYANQQPSDMNSNQSNIEGSTTNG